MKKLVLLSISILFIYGCSSMQYAYVGPKEVTNKGSSIPVKIIYVDDEEYYVFGNENIEIAAKIDTHSDGLSSTLAIKNLSSGSINVIPENFSLSTFDNVKTYTNQQSKTYQIEPYKSYLARIERARYRQEVLNALNGIVTSAQAGYAVGEALGGGSTTTTETSGFVGDEYFSATSTTQNNPADDLARAATLLNAQSNMDAYTLQKYESQLISIQDWFLKKNTIAPGEMTMGNVLFMTGKQDFQKVTLYIEVDDEIYSLDFNLVITQ